MHASKFSGALPVQSSHIDYRLQITSLKFMWLHLHRSLQHVIFVGLRWVDWSDFELSWVVLIKLLWLKFEFLYKLVSFVSVKFCWFKLG